MDYVKVEEIIDLIAVRCAFLNKQRMEAIGYIDAAPRGRLAIKTIKGKKRYYWRESPKDTNGRYLSADKIETIEKLAQKECAEETMEVIDRELAVLEKCLRELRKLTPDGVEDVHENLDGNIKELSLPVVESDSEFAERWKQENFDESNFYEENKKIVTITGQKVRSKSELIVASILRNSDVIFKYERPLCLGYYKIHPDFKVLDVRRRREIYWEHFGLTENPDYAMTAVKKISRFSAAGVNCGNELIVTAEANDIEFSEMEIYQIVADRKLGGWEHKAA